MVPGTLVYTFIGTTIASVGDVISGNTGDDEDSSGKILSLVLLIVGSILACGAIIYISYVVKRYLNKALADQEAKERNENADGETR